MVHSYLMLIIYDSVSVILNVYPGFLKKEKFIMKCVREAGEQFSK